MSYTLPRLVGSGRAFDLLLTARVVDADEALHLGIVTDVVDDGAVVDRALEIANTICSYTAFGVVMTKEIMWSNLDAQSMESAIHLENRTQILAGFGGEIMEAAERFMQGRAERG